MEKIIIGSDHAGYDMKEKIIAFLNELGFEMVDKGTFSKESVHYPVYAKKVIETMQNEKVEKAILICGTGIGMSIAANKFKNIRAAMCHSEFDAEMTRRHNNSNVLVLGGRTTGIEIALRIVKKWVETGFEGGRHQERIDLIADIEK